MAAACGLQAGDHVLGDLSGVEGIAALHGHAAQHFGLSRRAEDVAGAGRFAVDEEVIPRASLKGAAVGGPVKGHARGDGHPRLGIVDRGGEQGVQPQFAGAFREVAEGVDGRGDGHGIRRAERHRLLALVPQFRGIQRRWRAAGPVKGMDLLAPRRGVEHETVAADPGHLRLANAEEHRSGDGRVHRVAAPRKDIDRRPRGQRMRCGADAVGGQDR